LADAFLFAYLDRVRPRSGSEWGQTLNAIVNGV